MLSACRSKNQSVDTQVDPLNIGSRPTRRNSTICTVRWFANTAILVLGKQLICVPNICDISLVYDFNGNAVKAAKEEEDQVTYFVNDDSVCRTASGKASRSAKLFCSLKVIEGFFYDIAK